MSLMAWFRAHVTGRSVPDTDTGGREAHELAKKLADEVRQRWPEVHDVRNGIDEVISRNNLADAMRKAFRARG